MQKPWDSFSCRIFAGFPAQLAAEDIDPQSIFSSLPFDEAYLRDPRNSLAWQEYLDLLAALAAACGGPDGLEDFSARAFSHVANTQLIHVYGLAVSPLQLYRIIFAWAPGGPQGLRREVRELDDQRIEISFEVQPPLLDSSLLWRNFAGIARGLPTLLGLPQAIVDVHQIDAGRATLVVRPPPSASLWSRVRRTLAVFRASRTAIDELIEQQIELRSGYDALQRANREISEHAEQLELEMKRREKIEQELLHAQKMEVVGQLAGGIAHDFNNLLTVILGYTEHMSEELAKDDPLREDLDEIRHAAEQSAELTHQLLAFSRRHVIEPRLLDLNLVVAQTHRMLGRVLDERVELRIQLASASCDVWADLSQLEQVLLNLCLNARDAIAVAGTLTIETGDLYLEAAADVPRPGPHVFLRVSDDGCGMDATTLARVFEPFYTTKAEGQGTGLGLSTVYGIVAQHEGVIRIQSAVGEGTHISVYLPRADGCPSEEPAALALAL